MVNEATHSRLIIAALACAALTVALGGAVSIGIGASLDRTLLSAAALRAGRDSTALITFFQTVSWLGDTVRRSAMVLLLAAWLLWKQRRRAALVMMLVPTVAAITNSLLKEAFARVRPDIVPHLDSIGNLAYPSGHATNAMAFFLLVALLFATKRPGLWRTIAVALALLVGGSRLALGVHWPSDVIGGWLWGVAFALGGWSTIRHAEARQGRG